MTDSPNLPVFNARDLPERTSDADIRANRYTMAALERHKREGMDLALRARWAGLAVVSLLMVFLNPAWEMLYYHVGLWILALTGWVQHRVARVGRSRLELLVLGFELTFLAVMFIVPHPTLAMDWPDAVTFRFDSFMFYFMILALGTLAYSWRTIMAIGNWTALIWMIGTLCVWLWGKTDPAMGEAAFAAFGHDERLWDLFDPNSVQWDMRIQQVVAFLICAGILSLTVRRFNRLLLGNAMLERERTNLSRYFAPTVVDELSRNDEPLKQIRQQNVAVLFVDLRDFTTYSNGRAPEEVIATLRDFMGRMEDAVFRQAGTLDKFLGDGLMATFGTPSVSDDDASRALACLRAMRREVAHFNASRRATGQQELQAGFGLHYGPVVLGDIGRNRLEYAVIGATVNLASRLEAATRDLGAQAVISEALAQKIEVEGGSALLDGWQPMVAPYLKGVESQTRIRVQT